MNLTKFLAVGAIAGLGFVWVAGQHVAFAATLPPGRKVMRLDAVKVEGRMQKPQAFYILQRSNLNFEGLELQQSFIPKIIKSIDEKPFR